MLTVSPLVSAFAAAAVVLGAGLLLLPLLDRGRTLWRTLLLGTATILAWRYMAWRFTDTVPAFALAPEPILAWAFAGLEGLTVISSTIAFLILTRVRERGEEATRHAKWWAPGPPPRVDVFIATYNEELEVLERTLVGAKALDHPATGVYVLDDGRRDWLREVCARHGVGYLIRPDNAHAKAGNINHALSLRMREADAPDFVAVLDADFVPHRDFVSRTLALFHDSNVGLVQTPQHFFNADPVQHNLGISRAYPDEQRHFFDNVEASRDAWGIAVCCGTSSMVRTAAVQAIGGLPTESVTEDFLLSLRLAENGWQTVYLNEALTEGLAPEGLQEYIVQRGRWCLGMMQIIRNVYGPFGGHGLTLRHRVSILDSLLYWTTTFPFRLASLTCPLLYWYFGITMVNASVEDIVAYYLPYYIAVMMVLNWLSNGLFIPILNDVSQLLAAWPITRAVAVGLLTPGPHKFRVTAKGGDRTRIVVQWPLMRPFLALFGLTLAGLILALTSDFTFNYSEVAGDGRVIILFWTLYNLAVLAITMAACIERPRSNQPLRQQVERVELTVDSRRLGAWLTDLGTDQARLSGIAGAAPGSAGQLIIPGIGPVSARVLAETSDGCRVALTPEPEQRDRIISRLHTAAGAPGTGRGDLGLMLRELARGLTR
ncbi:glycosyltransferase [Methylobacterium nigriterrae]|uniref:glycosyltransferase n=1 Tax=Methylobacterium nigriterrae TaxID=3127512 RepID=UPI003013373C